MLSKHHISKEVHEIVFEILVRNALIQKYETKKPAEKIGFVFNTNKPAALEAPAKISRRCESEHLRMSDSMHENLNLCELSKILRSFLCSQVA